MNRRALGLGVMILLCTPIVYPQSRTEEQGVKEPPEEVRARNMRLHDVLQKPDSITLRLAYSDAYQRPTDTPQSYKVKDTISFLLLMTQSLSEPIQFEQKLDPFDNTRTELFKDGDKVVYSKAAQLRIDRADNEPPSGSAATITLLPGRESGGVAIRVEDWYGILGTGHYQLSVRKRFVWDGAWIESNALTFEVESRRPAPIPDGLTIKMVPSALDENIGRRPYRLGSDVRVAIIAVNNSEQRIRVEVVDSHYGDRPQLFRQGQLVPYSSEAEKAYRMKEEHASAVGQASNFFLEPNTMTPLGEFSLNTWYGPLPTGSYRLVNRRRFEIDGPWTSDSAELLFEIVR